MEAAVQPQGNAFYGWFDDPDQTEPTYEPPRDAPCPFCGFAVHAEDVRTHSVLYRGQYAARTYFYRTHRTCAQRDSTHAAADGFILDMIARNGD
ncbi:MAG: hypothetical protein ACREHF_09460 [Rhizomicrobium sp.]